MLKMRVFNDYWSTDVATTFVFGYSDLGRDQVPARSTQTLATERLQSEWTVLVASLCGSSAPRSHTGTFPVILASEGTR